MMQPFTTETPLLITGGSGFVGKHVQAYFRSQGFSVFAPRHAELELEDAVAVQRYIEANHIQYVVHAASRGATPEAHMPEGRILQHNLAIFHHLTDAMVGRGLLVNLGSGAEYGKHRALIEVKEDEAGLYMPKDAYGQAKLAISRRIEQLPNAVNLRLFGVFGMGEDMKRRFISYAIHQHLQGKPIEMRQNVRFSYLWVNDVAPAIHALFKQPPAEKVFNLVPAKPVTLKEIVGCIKAATHQAASLHIQQPGMNVEYSGNGGLFMAHYPDVCLTPTEQAVQKLIRAYS
jgi:nucleoside-diphosphate-sugar epimerase